MLVEQIKQEIEWILHDVNDVNSLLDAYEALGGDSVKFVREYVGQTKTTQDSDQAYLAVDSSFIY